MIHQREQSARNFNVDLESEYVHLFLPPRHVLTICRHRVVPLISIFHSTIYMIFATYLPDYYDFLLTGQVSANPHTSKDQFLTLEEYGPIHMDQPNGFPRASKLIGALNLYLQEKGALPT